MRRIIRDLFADPVTMEEIEEADRFLQTFHAGGTPYRWDRDMWVRIVEEFDGVIPIKIEAFREGSVVFPYEPVIQVTAQTGFGELAAWFESKLLHVWGASERVTVLRWWWEYLREGCRKAHPSWTDEQVDFATSIMTHDFGDRAALCSMESEILGEAHTLVVPGTDTVAGAYQNWKRSEETPYACSIHALAHRTVMSFGRERTCHAELLSVNDQTHITAHVSDTYDFHETVQQLCAVAADWTVEKAHDVIVLRPDSGNALECVMFIMQTAERYGLFQTDPDTGLKVATRVRWIQGDSVDWPTMISIMDACLAAGYSPFGWGAFGVGGGLRNTIARDHTGLSMKLAAVGNDSRPTVKRSLTPAKSSIPGIVSVMDNMDDENRSTVFSGRYSSEQGNLLELWYNGMIPGIDLHRVFLAPCLEDNRDVRARIHNDFLSRAQPTEVLSAEIRAERDRLFAEGGW